MKGDFTLRNFTLQSLFLDIKNMQLIFTHISFASVYKDKNNEACSPKKGENLGNP